jgi:hypothetical protein
MTSNADAYFLMWWEPNPKRAPSQSIAEGVAAYMNRFQTPPHVVYVHATGMAEVEGVRVALPPPGKLVVPQHTFAIGETTLE